MVTTLQVNADTIRQAVTNHPALGQLSVEQAEALTAVFVQHLQERAVVANVAPAAAASAIAVEASGSSVASGGAAAQATMHEGGGITGNANAIKQHALPPTQEELMEIAELNGGDFVAEPGTREIRPRLR